MKSLPVKSLLYLLRDAFRLNSVDGLLCFCGFYGDVDSDTAVVIWNPTVRKSVGIVIPKASNMKTIVGFGVCPDTSDLKLVRSVSLKYLVFVDGVIYFHAYDDASLDQGLLFNFVISFDFKSEKFGEVCLPERLVHTPYLAMAKVNESLGLLEYYDEGGMKVCGVWSRKDGANNQFTTIYTIKVEGKWYNRVLGFRNNGEVVMEL
ncbi:zinc finger, CCHC-type containing protein [Tanacetum coccineum]